MSALSERHEAEFARFFDMQAELISAPRLKELLRNRMDQVELILSDKEMSEKTRWQAEGEFQAIRAISLDINKLLGRR